ncbi:tyrosine-protein phosphatase [Altererythrobacter lutimaris]|uniref:Tyrosine-protein phosphatase n=1 Tax=Altererythrobacter lutimaris TaxID=2743979 RepID=A0A850H8Y1_9SPHN|nr:tyrosine-protein phosphatase [Altererythrobacter lutimaris]NVE94333.1 tyrosine-protein phosphatase [Altererythrobacter lutimaris]
MTDSTPLAPFLATDAIHNFRDYGGYAASGGRRVRTGLLFRSGHHAEASDGDLAMVSDLSLAHVIDLRGDNERARHTCKRPDGFGAQVHFFEGETAGLAPHLEAAEESIDAQGAHEAMTALYAALPDRAGLNWILKRYFEALAAGEGASLVHCAAGKDRTGIAVDLLHHVLGVHPDDAMEDYLLTNHSPRNEERIAHGMALMGGKYGAKDEATMRVLMGVDAAYLEAARASVKERFGSTDAYLEQLLGVDAVKRDALKAQLVDA